jgi:hypothetical protein
MSIPEGKLDTWSKQGSITQSSNTYASIKGVLEDSNTPYAGKVAVYLQGSYGNHTNVYGVESDIDIVCCLESAFQYDLSAMNAASQDNFQATHPTNATYGFSQFKADVTAQLKKAYGSDVSLGTKAIRIKANGTRRDADVLPCMNFRRYSKSSTGNDRNYYEGIYFVKSDGKSVNNFPVQHYDNCVAKHQATNHYFKRTVRIFKNMRNRLIEHEIIKPGVAPSYFIEGMLWNVPKELFDASYSATVQACMAWLKKADSTKLVCANELYYLIRDNSDVCWNEADFVTFRAAVQDLWDNWYE